MYYTQNLANRQLIFIKALYNLALCYTEVILLLNQEDLQACLWCQETSSYLSWVLGTSNGPELDKEGEATAF